MNPSATSVDFPNEVLHHIFQYIKYMEDTSTDDSRTTRPSWRRTLAQLSCTCKRFSSISLDLLWEEGNLFFALLQIGFPLTQTRLTNIIPSFCIFSVDTDQVSASLTEEIPRGVSWDRFASYARRIRHLRIAAGSNLSMPVVKDDVFQLLKKCLRSQHDIPYLFPHLSSLTIAADGKEKYFIPYLRLFSSPDLTSFTFANCDFSKPNIHGEDSQNYTPELLTTSFLEAMKDFSPHLKRLELRPREHLTETHHFTTLSRSLMTSDLSYLTILVVEGVSMDALAHIGYFSNLTELKAKLGSRSAWDNDKVKDSEAFLQSIQAHKKEHGRAFKNLQICHLWGFSVEFMVVFLESITPCTTLSNVDFHPYPDFVSNRKRRIRQEREGFLKIRNALVSCCSPGSESLEQVVISGSNSLTERHFKPHMALPPDALEPLLTFPNLKFVDISSTLLDIDDSFLERASKAWPKLRTLRLGSAYGVMLTSPVTLRALIPLLQGCPDLQDIGLVFDDDLIPSPEEVPEPLHRVMRTFNVANSTAADFADDLPSDSGASNSDNIDTAVWDGISAKRKAIAEFLARLFSEVHLMIAWDGDPGSAYDFEREDHDAWEEVFDFLNDLNVRCGDILKRRGYLAVGGLRMDISGFIPATSARRSS